MSANQDTRAAWQFHDATKYTLVSQTGGDDDILMGTPPNLGPAIGAQDPANEPQAFKVYTAAPALELPREFPAFDMPALDALAAIGNEGDATPTLDTLAQLGMFSNGILKSAVRGSGATFYYRMAGCTGGRYHLELYFVTGDLPGLDAGVYHYAADQHTFRRLRAGDYRAALVEASGGEPALAEAPAVLALSSTFWRNAWRYQGRAYRHTYWDLGTYLANILAVSAAQHVPAKLVLGYADDEVDRVLGIDGARESTVALVALGNGSPAGGTGVAPPLDQPTEPVSAWEIEFPDITAMHAAAKLPDGAEAAAWRSTPLHRHISTGSDLIPLRPFAPQDRPDIPIDTVIRRRRSTRHFDTAVEIPFEKLSSLIDTSMRGIASDCLDYSAPPIDDQYLIVNNVAGLERGTYVVDPNGGGLELLKRGDMRADATRLACDQQYAGDAHVNVYYLANLEPILERYGNRGYRVAQIEASLFAGKLHLATHALGLGAVGSTSMDDEVTNFFSPHAAGKSFMFILTFGQKRRRTAG